jgi:hypothetical protein
MDALSSYLKQTMTDCFTIETLCWTLSILRGIFHIPVPQTMNYVQHGVPIMNQPLSQAYGEPLGYFTVIQFCWLIMCYIVGLQRAEHRRRIMILYET